MHTDKRKGISGTTVRDSSSTCVQFHPGGTAGKGKISVLALGKIFRICHFYCV